MEIIIKLLGGILQQSLKTILFLIAQAATQTVNQGAHGGGHIGGGHIGGGHIGGGHIPAHGGHISAHDVPIGGGHISGGGHGISGGSGNLYKLYKLMSKSGGFENHGKFFNPYFFILGILQVTNDELITTENAFFGNAIAQTRLLKVQIGHIPDITQTYFCL